MTVMKLLRWLRINVKEKIIVNQFHKLYYGRCSRTWGNTFWMGVPVLKCPLDMWVYQEIIFEIKPDIIIECGTANGGGALFLASVCDLIDHGEIVTIDVAEQGCPAHKRIKFLLGSSVSEEILEKVREAVAGKEKVMVILDSAHDKEHVLNELRKYSGLVSKGSYIIVEDSNINGHPVSPGSGPGPMEAVKEFLKEKGKEFIIDKTKEKFFLTFFPNGYLKRTG
ncbi:MAG: CmcI family methyltransferase [bacterium]